MHGGWFHGFRPAGGCCYRLDDLLPGIPSYLYQAFLETGVGAVNTAPVINSACGVELRIVCAVTPASTQLF